MIQKQLENLRKLMKKHKIDSCLIPGTDPHQSEYLPEHWKRRLYISGFTGSSGNIVITMKKAILWTDRRYELQVEQETKDTAFDYEIKERRTHSLKAEIDWIINEFKRGGTIGIDPKLVTINQAEYIEESIKDNKKISIKYVEENLIDSIWEDQPPSPKSLVTFRDETYENIPSKDKIKNLQKIMREKKNDIHVVSNLESIARLLNVRGNDDECNLLVISYLIVEQNKVLWFIDKEKLPRDYSSKVPKNVTILPYDEVASKLKNLSKNKNILIDPDEISKWVADSIDKSANIVKDTSPLMMMKAIKNEFEISQISDAHIKDGIAMIKLIHWLKNEIKKQNLSEYEVAEKTLEFRKEREGFQKLSFSTIVGYGPNGAIVHYRPKKKTCIDLKPKGIVLIDSGAHYLNGTTDITRTIALGEVSREMIENYTRVLKGHIDLAKIIFPKSTRACQIDVLARQSLWNAGLNYQHGTGHGIGYSTCVHETSGVGINELKPVVLEEGMILTNEPGYYKDGGYGIRIENVMAVEKDDKSDFLRFKQITLCPYEKELIDKSVLDQSQINWINNYHNLVLESLGPVVDDKDLLLWLEDACSLI